MVLLSQIRALVLAAPKSAAKNDFLGPEEMSQKARKIAAQLDEVTLECPEALWPDSNWRGKSVFLFDPINNLAWKWLGKGKQGELKRIAPDLIPKKLHVYTSPYVVGINEYVGIRLQDSILDKMLDKFKDKLTEADTKYGTDYASLIFHEGFHFLVQVSEKWRDLSSMPRSSRIEDFPAKWRPRYYRHRIAMTLWKAYHEPNPIKRRKLLSKTKYWHNKYETEFPEDAAKNRQNDFIEGTARYYEFLAQAIGKHGCNNPDKWHSSIKSDSKYNKPPKLSSKGDSESYTIYGLACLILHENAFPGWQERVQKGESPIQILVRDIIATKDKDDEKSKLKAQQDIEATNKKDEITINELQKKYESGDYALIAFPPDLIYGNYSFEKLQSTPELLGRSAGYIYKNMSASLKRDHPLLDIKIQIQHIIAVGGTPCQKLRSAIVALVPRKNIEKNGRTITVKTETFQFEGEIQEATDNQGRIWYCASGQQ